MSPNTPTATAKAAAAGEEWIATLISPHAKYTDFDWRDRIADLEEIAESKVLSA